MFFLPHFHPNIALANIAVLRTFAGITNIFSTKVTGALHLNLFNFLKRAGRATKRQSRETFVETKQKYEP